tara:strand:- start:127 stop:240 length:114 start_codon:yes stop_codon:yes gene_type:complete
MKGESVSKESSRHLMFQQKEETVEDSELNKTLEQGKA